MKTLLITCNSGFIQRTMVNVFSVDDIKSNVLDGKPHKIWGTFKKEELPKGCVKVPFIDADVIAVDLYNRSQFKKFYRLNRKDYPTLFSFYDSAFHENIGDEFIVNTYYDISCTIKTMKNSIDKLLGDCGELEKLLALFNWNNRRWESLIYVPTDAMVISSDKIKVGLKDTSNQLDSVESVVNLMKLAITSEENANLAKNIMINSGYSKYLELIPIVFMTDFPSEVKRKICVNCMNDNMIAFINKSKSRTRYRLNSGFDVIYNDFFNERPYKYNYKTGRASYCPEIYKDMMCELTSLNSKEIDEAYDLIVNEIPIRFSNFFKKYY